MLGVVLLPKRLAIPSAISDWSTTLYLSNTDLVRQPLSFMMTPSETPARRHISRETAAQIVDKPIGYTRAFRRHLPCGAHHTNAERFPVV